MHMVALYTVWYNFVRIHKTLKVTPGHGRWPLADPVEHGGRAGLVDAAAPKPGKRGPYKKQECKGRIDCVPDGGAKLYQPADA